MAEFRLAGQSVARSPPGLPTAAPPAWFAAVTAQHLAPQEMPVSNGVIRLSALQDSEIGERWNDAGHLIGLLALSAGVAAIFCFVTAAWSLRPLRPLAEALARLECGQQAEPLAAGGAAGMGRLGPAVNRMQAALSRAAGENRRLSEQLERLAEDERVELARDLHDESGPLLYALTA